jgi:hypothetical protein
MRFIIKFLLIGLFAISPAFADYTICWTPPTENTDNSPLTDLAGYNMWAIPIDRTYGTPQVLPAIPAGDCPGRGPADCHFQDTDGRMCYHKYWPSPEGDWKAKMQSINADGVTSADSVELLFTLQDLNGDNNPDVVGGADPGPVVIPPIEPPVEPPPETARSNIMSITRKGFYTITGPDGLLMLKPDGTERNVTSRDEAYEWITRDGRCCIFTINQPYIEVEFK